MVTAFGSRGKLNLDAVDTVDAIDEEDQDEDEGDLKTVLQFGNDRVVGDEALFPNY